MSASSFGGLDALGHGPDDEAGPLRAHPVHDLAEPAPLAVLLDAARDADVIDGRHEDEVPAGERDVARDAGALRPDRILRDLDDDLLALLQQVLDVLRLLRALLLAVPLRPPRSRPSRPSLAPFARPSRPSRAVPRVLPVPRGGRVVAALAAVGRARARLAGGLTVAHLAPGRRSGLRGAGRRRRRGAGGAARRLRGAAGAHLGGRLRGRAPGPRAAGPAAPAPPGTAAMPISFVRGIAVSGGGGGSAPSG